MPTPSDPDKKPFPPDPQYKWRLSNDIEGEDWEFLNAEHERTGEYGDLLDEKIDLEFRLHDLKEKLGIIPPTPPVPPKKTTIPPAKAGPKRSTQAPPVPKTQAAPPKAQTPPAPKAQPAAVKANVPPAPTAQATPSPKTETPSVQQRIRMKHAPAPPAPPRVLITTPPQTSAGNDAEADAEAEVEGHPS